MVLSAVGRAQLWLWIWLFCSWSHGGLAGLQPMKPAPAPIPQFTSHSGQVCSTWGNNHFKTFNGDIYHYPGTCNYLFASHCKSNNEDFNIEIQRTVENGKPVISHITARLFGVVVEIRDKVITLDGVLVKEMPAEKARVRVDKLGNNIKITASNDIVMLLNGEDNLLLKLNRNKYANQTCGLCGDFSGVSGFTLDGLQITAIQYGNLQKRNIPTEECADVPPPPPNYCKDTAEICKSILTSRAFSKCNEILKPMHYIDSCVQDLCRCGAENRMECQCSMFAEYSRQCTHAGGVPGNWRGPDMCPQSCDHNMVYQEYGSPCPNTCSNTERTTVCEDHGIDGCFCPPGTVLDDINNAGCIPPNECSCVYNSEIYTPGSSFSAPCRECTCAKGKWKCHELPCKGTCSVEGGSHITSFDGSHYTINADCTYVLAKHNDFSVLVELRRCGMANKKSCMKSLTLAMKNGENVLVIKDSGMTLLNWIPTQLPVSVGNITVFWSTSFYINIHTHSDVSMQVRIVPTMQVHMTLGPSYHDQTWGLCGNFNNIQSDDFKTISGVSEGTAASFANAYKSNSNCPNIKNNFEDPCSLNIEAEKYAQHWCGLLTIPNGPFSSCHAEVKPLSYYTNCLWDTCSCQDSEECMCAALASYTYACAKKGVTIIGWRDNVCDKYTKSCKDSQVYQYNVTRCQPTCRSRSHDDIRFDFNFSPVDGCVCIEGTYMNDNGDCVTPSSCPCYYQGNVMQSGEMVEENGMKCTCDKGELTCMGAVIKKTDLSPVCSDPLVYLNCSSAPKGTKGVECQKSCNTLDMDCFSSQCVSGCVCPPGWVSDEEGGCISEPQCPCTHNEAIYQPGQSISVGCNTCTCKNRRWDCTHNECLGTCSVYGDGHYITFDNKQYTFSGNCEYVLVQDNCGGTEDKSHFKVITENVPCGSTGTTCSKTIKFFIGGHELRFNNERIEVVKRNGKEKIPCTVMQRGMYFIFKCDNGVILIWDKKTTIHTKLDSHFKGKVCGLCGNYDDKESNDFTTRSQSVVENLIEFCNTWKTDPSCPDVRIINDPCSMNPYRKNWALRQCSIIISDVFARCHSQVAPGKYYESCISDSCACDTGGDCECFCTTVALYAQACSQSGICINWRTPTICPMFCDYYNDVGDCEWHYKPCGDKCIKTCRNPKGECLHEVSGCEGCYPKCPPSRPFFNEDTMKCVAKCGCVDEDGTHYNYGERVKSSRNCDKCVCTMNEGIDCQYDINACVCEHEGKRYEYNTTITNDDVNCSVMKCGENGQIVTIKDICTTTKKPATDRVEIHTSTKATESTTNVTTLTTMATKSHSSTSSTDNDTSFPTTKILNPYSTGTAPPTSTTATSKVASSRSRSTSRSHSTKLTVTPNDTPSNTPETTQTGHSTSSFTSSSSTVIPKSKSTFSSHSTAVTQTATGAPSNTPETVETEHTTSSFTSSSSTVIPTTYMPCKEYECEWSKWFDDSHPTSEMKGGDQENFNTAEAKGTMVCPHGKVITDIKCRATSYSSIPLKELGQNVTCNKETGLLCRNEDNPENAYMCLNYEACYRCCKYYCPTSTPITTTKQSTISHSTASISDIYSSSPATETMSPPSIGTAPPTSKVASSRSKSTFPSHSTAVTQTGTRTPSNTPETVETEHTTSSFTSTSSTVIPTTYMPCKEYECEWSKWFDDSHPTSEMKGGDQENFNTAEAKGTMVCPHGKVITDIKCRATSYSSIPLKELGQNVTCNKETGLLCRNEDNPDNAYMCLNYEACYRCCKYYCPTSTPIATTKQSTISHSTASISDIYSSSPATETMSPPSIGTAPPTSKVASSRSKSTFPSHSTAVTQTGTRTPSNTPETVETEHTTSSFTSSSSTVIPTTYMPCKEYECEWSKWFDDSHPTSEMKGGDQENFNTAEAKGIMVCPHGKVITDIKCRATSYSSIPLKELGQNVTCNKETGLLCRNEDNPENAYMCLNYEACYRCCKYYCPTSTPITTTKQSTISHSTASITDIYSSSLATETMSPPSIGTAPPTSKVASSRSKSTFPSHSTAVTQTGTRTPSNTPETVETEHTTSSFTSSSSTVIPTTYMPCKEYECEWSKWFDDSHPTSEMKGGDQENFNTAEAKGIMVCPHGKVITDIKCRATSYSSIPLKELGQNVTCNKETGLLCRNEDNPENAYMCLNYEACYRCCKYYCPTSTPITTTKQSTISHSTASITDIYSSSPATETMSPPSIGTAPPTSKVASSRSKSTFPSHSTAVTQTGTRTPSNTPETVETEHTTSSFTSSSSTVIPTTYMPCKEYECEWSKWFDDSHPTSEMKGGDQENFNTAEAKGTMVCPHGKVITDIKCRATSYSSIPLKELGQNVTCNKETGLLCRNEDNPDNAYMCLNYEACYRCCKYYCPTSTPIATTKQSTISHSTASISDIYSSSPATETMSPPSIGTAPPTSKVASSRSKSTFPSHSTAVTQTGTRTPSNTPETVETEHTTSSFTSSSSTVIPTTYMPCKEYECEWSKWFDDSHPTSEMKGGDQENFNTAEAKGIMVCPHGKVITDIKCRATSYSSIPLKELGQNVTCNKETGLLCRNEDNPENAYMCLNYEACYRCCKYYCPTSTPITTTKQSTISHSTASITDIYSSSLATETMSPPSIGTAPPTSKVASSRSKSTFPSHSTAVTQTGTRTPSNTPETVETEHTTSSFTSSSSTVIPTTYMPCKEYECEWSKWFDDSHPTSEMKGGDQENFNTAEAKGIMVCPHGKVITDIKCRATSYSSIPLKELGQNVTCNKETGLLCRNEDNPENAYMCLNYEACYRCCKYYCPTSTPITTTKQSTISHSTASITDIYSSSPATETMSPPSIGTAPPTSKVASSRSKSTFPSHSTAVTQTGTRTPSNTPETVETEHTTSSFTSSSSTVIPTTYMPCKEYECEWSKWFDDSHPTSEMKGGDQENFNTAEAKGTMVCPHGKVITDIKCRATSYSSIPLKELGQNVTCNKETGLLCRNEDNPENAYMCLNYEACYRCCKYYCPTSTPITTTKQSTISHSTASIANNYSSSPATETMSPPSIGTAPPTSKVASSRSKSTFPSHSTAVTQTGTRTPSNTPETVETEHTTSSFTSSSSTVIPTTYMPCKEYECEWSKWFDDSHPTSEMKGGDQENFNTAEAKGTMVCPHGKVITDIKCRATSYSSIPLKELGQNVTCNKETGLLCRNEDNPENAYMCLNYEACYRCCKYYCPSSTPITTTKQSTISHSTASITDIYSSSLATETMSPPSIGTAPPTSKVASSRSKSTFPSHSTAVTQTGTRTPSNTPETVETEHTTSSFTSSSSTVIPKTYMPCKEYECEWSKWFDDSHPTSEMKGGDQENFNTAEAKGTMVCPHGKVITDIKCRATSYSSIPLKELGQNVTCNKETGLLCRNEDNPENAYMCLNYEACYRCCKYYCPTSTPITTTKQSTISHSTASISDIYSSSPATETMSPPSIGTAPPTSKVASSRSKSTFPSHSTAVTQTGTRTPSNTPETVETEHTTSSFTSTSSTVIPTTYMPCKEYECEWSKWFDDSHPTSEMKGGDQENFNTAEAKGIMVCPHGKVITDIKCRATSYSSIPLKELGQNVTCNKETGLLCRNEDNPENAYMCLNYEACYRCCKYYCPTSTPITTTKQSTISHSTASITDIYSSSLATETMSPPSIGTAPPTSKVASSRSKSTFPSHSTAVTQTGTRTPSNTPETVETEHTTSSFTSSSSTVIPKTYMPCKEYECEWSKWFDDSHPTSEMKGGDQENFNTAEAKGTMVCPHGKVITDIKCRATSYSSIPLKELGQNVTCNKETGLLCRNEDNPENAYMCLNYEACYRCCKYYCPTSTPITTTKQSTISHSTASISDIYSSSPATETMSPPSIGTAPPTSKVASSRSKSTFPSHSTAVTQTGTRTPSNTPETVETEHTTSSFTSSSSTVIPTTYMPCKEYECEWSKWFDDSHPTSEMKGGDQENFNTAEAKGIMVCPHGKVITDIKCRATSYSSIPLKELGQNVTCNKETGLLCRNEDNPENAYMCLNYEACYRCCKYYCPTSTPITTTKQSTISHSTASISDIYSSSPATETMSPPSIGTAPPTSTTTTSQVASSRSKSTFPSHSTALTQTSTRTPSNTPETVETEHTTSSFTSSSSTIIPTTYMPCKEYECEWSKWFDQSHPTSDMKGGDQENFKLLEAKGIKVCPHGKVITDIQCRATSYSSIPIEELPQKVTCNKETGLLCMNENNPEYFNMCFNYEIRYNCCKSVCPSFPYISPTTSSVSTSGTRPVFISTLTPPESQTASSPLTEGGSKSSHQPVTTKISTVTERPHFCVHDGSIYKEGASVSIDPESCEECKCILLEDTSIVECRRMECSIECPLGYSYTELPGECCGKCVKNVCFFDATEVVKDESNKVLPEKCCENCDQDVCSKNNTLLIKPGKLWRVPGDNCTSYDCDPRTLKIVKKVMSCPVQRPLKCSQGILVNFTSADGCCTIQHCEPRKCDVMKSWKVIESEGCKANVTLTNCGGYCSSISRYPSFPKMVEHDCTCCQPTRTTEKKVHLQCEDGRKTSYKYTDVLQCACRGAECVFTE